MVSSGFALEAQVASSNHRPDMHLDFGVVREGYGWVFPKEQHLNVGLYSVSRQHKITRAALAEYVQKKLGTDKISCVIGQYLGMGGREILIVAGVFCSPAMPRVW